VGLHYEDVKKLVEILHQLVNKGNTVLVIEHNLEVVKNADYVIDLGPEGGAGGGQLMAKGTPEEVARVAGSHTAKYLRPILQK
jgi:excinuclease ABC subunit A